MPKKKKNNKNKQIIVSVLAIIIIFVTIGVISSLFNDSYAVDIATGESGTCIWNIDEEGKLTIEPESGSSTCTLKSSASYSDVPWYNYRTSITSVVVEQGVKTNTRATYLFYEMSNATSIDVTNLDTSNATSLGNMFTNCYSITSLDVTHFNTSSVTNMKGMFQNCHSLVNLDVTHFDTSNVTTMDSMFDYCDSLTSLDVTHFNTGEVTNMYDMFRNCSCLTSIDVTHFNTNSVTNMSGMFSGCSSLTSLDVTHFNTSSVTSMASMFSSCSSITSLDVTHFNTSSVTSMASMFSGCRSLTNLDVTNFDTSSVTTMSYMFSNCSSLTSLDVTNFDTSSVTTMSHMFSSCSSLSSLDVTNFDTSKVTTMDSMFSNCSSLTSLDVTNFDTSSVTNMREMFKGCSSLTSLDVSKFNTSSVTNMQYMFSICRSLTSLNVTHFDTSKVTTMESMFSSCNSLTSLDVTHFDTSSVTTMESMFSNCSSLTSLDVTNFNTSSVTSMYYMFTNCKSLAELDLSSFDMSAISSSSDVGIMLQGLGENNNQGCKLKLNNTFNNTTYNRTNGYRFPWGYYAKETNGTVGSTLYNLTDMQTETVNSSSPTTWVPAYSVTYDKNGGDSVSGTPNPNIQRIGTNVNTTGYSATRTGYTFNNWNTKANGSGTTFAKNAASSTDYGTKYSTTGLTNGNINLYAQYEANTFTPAITMSIPNEKSLYKTGDTITYNIVVTNNESFAITNVVVSDPNGTMTNGTGYTVNNSHQATIANIPAGESVTISVTKTIEESDVNTFTNTATITEAEAANGATLEGTPRASKSVNVQSLIKITKQVKGNIAKLSEYFKVKIIIGGATGDKYTISGQSYTGEGKQTTYTVGEDNYIYLKSGETITIGDGASDSRIPGGIIYQVVENTNTYNTYINGSSTNSKDSGDLTTSTTTNTNEVSIINSKEAQVPTERRIKYIPYLIVSLLILIPVIILKISPKKS